MKRASAAAPVRGLLAPALLRLDGENRSVGTGRGARAAACVCSSSPRGASNDDVSSGPRESSPQSYRVSQSNDNDCRGNRLHALKIIAQPRLTGALDPARLCIMKPRYNAPRSTVIFSALPARDTFDRHNKRSRRTERD